MSSFPAFVFGEQFICGGRMAPTFFLPGIGLRQGNQVQHSALADQVTRDNMPRPDCDPRRQVMEPILNSFYWHKSPIGHLTSPSWIALRHTTLTNGGAQPVTADNIVAIEGLVPTAVDGYPIFAFVDGCHHVAKTNAIRSLLLDGIYQSFMQIGPVQLIVLFAIFGFEILAKSRFATGFPPS